MCSQRHGLCAITTSTALFVTNGNEIIGILTDTDMVRRVVAAGVDTLTTTAEKIMRRLRSSRLKEIKPS